MEVEGRLPSFLWGQPYSNFTKRDLRSSQRIMIQDIGDRKEFQCAPVRKREVYLGKQIHLHGRSWAIESETLLGFSGSSFRGNSVRWIHI